MKVLQCTGRTPQANRKAVPSSRCDLIIATEIKIFNTLFFTNESPMAVILSSSRVALWRLSLFNKQMGLRRTHDKITHTFAVTLITLRPLTSRILIVLFMTKAPVKIAMHSSSNESPTLRQLILDIGHCNSFDSAKIRHVRWYCLLFQAPTNYDDPPVNWWTLSLL